MTNCADPGTGCRVYYLMPTGRKHWTLVHRWARTVYTDRSHNDGLFIDTGTGIQGPFSSTDAVRAAIRVATGEEFYG